MVLSVVAMLYSASADNECSFVRSYKGEQCVYNIHLSQNDHHCKGSRRGRRHQDNRFNVDPEKIDTMQRDFSYLKDEHEQRLKELEVSVRNLLGGDKVSDLLSETVGSLELPSRTSSSSSPRQGRVDDAVLDRLQEEFAKLRKALTEKTEELFDTQLKVNESRKMYEQSQLDLYSMNQQLLDAESKVALLERERAVLKNQLKDRAYKMEVKSDRLEECETKTTEQEDQLLTLIRSENTLSESLATCELMLNESDTKLQELEGRHKELKSKHSRTREILGIRERELIDCYAVTSPVALG
nr:hypothetical protein BaRGS_018583 [Batillaria attramentaria]